MFTPKFDYSKNKILRIDSPNGRQYDTSFGKVPSVTTILSACKSEEDKKSLTDWKDFIGEDKANTIVKESADIGTLVHKHLECYVCGEPRPSGTNLIRKISATLADSIIRNGLKNVSEIWGSEISLYYMSLWAGTADCIGIHKGTPAIIDFKNSRKVKSDQYVYYYKLQTVAYALAFNYLYGTDIRKTVIMLVVRDERNNKRDFAKYQEWVVEGEEFDYYAIEWAKMVKKYHETM